MRKTFNSLVAIGSGVALGVGTHYMDRYISVTPAEQNTQAQNCAKLGLQATKSETTVVPVVCQDYNFDYKEIKRVHYDASTGYSTTVSDKITYMMPSSGDFLKANILTPKDIKRQAHADKVEEWGFGIFGGVAMGGLMLFIDYSDARRKRLGEDFADDDFDDDEGDGEEYSVYPDS